MKTNDIQKVPMERYAFGKSYNGFHTTAKFYFSENGTMHYIDNIGDGFTHFTIRNSKTGVSKIILIDSELKSGRYAKTYFFNF